MNENNTFKLQEFWNINYSLLTHHTKTIFEPNIEQIPRQKIYKINWNLLVFEVDKNAVIEYVEDEALKRKRSYKRGPRLL